MADAQIARLSKALYEDQHSLNPELFGDDDDDLFRPALADDVKVGFFNIDRSCQTQQTDIVQLKEMTDVLHILIKDSKHIQRDLTLTRKKLETEYENKLQDKSSELYNRINHKLRELEAMHVERVGIVRRAYRQQLADALARVETLFQARFEKQMAKDREKHQAEMKKLNGQITALTQTIQRNESVIIMLKQQLATKQKAEEPPPREDTTKIDAMTKQLEAMKEQLKSKDRELGAMEDELDSKNSEINSTIERNTRLQNELEKESALKSQIQMELMEVKSQAAKSSGEAKRLKEMAEDLERQKAEMEQESEERTRRLKEEILGASAQKMREMQSDFSQKLGELVKQKESLEKELAMDWRARSDTSVHDRDFGQQVKMSSLALRTPTGVSEDSSLSSKAVSPRRRRDKLANIVKRAMARPFAHGGSGTDRFSGQNKKSSSGLLSHNISREKTGFGRRRVGSGRANRRGTDMEVADGRQLSYEHTEEINLRSINIPGTSSSQLLGEYGSKQNLTPKWSHHSQQNLYSSSFSALNTAISSHRHDNSVTAIDTKDKLSTLHEETDMSTTSLTTPRNPDILITSHHMSALNILASMSTERDKNQPPPPKKVVEEPMTDTAKLIKSERELRIHVEKLKKEIDRLNKAWEKKFTILQASLYALKDESYLRQHLEKQHTTLHQATISYTAGPPKHGKKHPVLPCIPNRAPSPDPLASYTVSRASNRHMLENQIASDEDDDDVIYGLQRNVPQRRSFQSAA